jgi:hypothetical protein
MNPMLLIFAVMITAGLFGGLINYHLSSREGKEGVNLARSLTVGTGASFLVPLFLNMISSNLLDVIRGTSAVPGDMSKLFVFAGFCLVAAISSKAFISTLSDRILREARETRREVEATKSELAGVQAVIEPIVAKETESDSGGPQIVRIQASAHDFTTEVGVSITPEARLLNALVPHRWTLRSLSGAAKEAGMDQIEASRILSAFVQQGLVGLQPTANGPRWFLTEQGRNVVSAGQAKGPEYEDEINRV